MEYKIITENIKKIIDISNSILKIYNKLADMDINGNYEEYNNYIEYLKISTYIEDNIYKEIFTECDMEDFYKIYNYKIHTYKINDEKKELIDDRIRNYTTSIRYDKNKIKNMHKNLEESSNKISICATYDFIYKLIDELNNIIKTSDNLILIKDSSIFKNETIYKYKSIEYKLLEKRYENNKKILLRHNFNKQLVDHIYSDFSNKNVDRLIDEILISPIDEENDNTVRLIFLKAHLNLLEPHLQAKKLQQFEQEILYHENFDLIDDHDIFSILKVFEDIGKKLHNKEKKKTNKYN